jgi:hypothetical protein
MLNAHNVLQRAAQNAFGTANTTATAKLQNVSNFAINPEFQTRALSQLRGTLAPTHQTTLDFYKSNATFEVADETFEDINYWLDSLFSEDDSPGGSDPYTRAYTAPTTSEPSPVFMTLQYGQANEVWQMQDASIATLTMSGSNNTGVQVGGSLIGGKVIEGSLQSLSDRSGTRMTGCMAALYIDTWGGYVGTTEVATSSFSWELTINTNRQYRGYLGDCTPAAWNDQKWNGQLRLSLELNNTTDDYLIAMLAATNDILEKQVEIAYTNSTTGLLQIQFAGHSMQAPQLFQDRNGVLSYDLILDGVYNSTMGNWLKIDTTSEIDSLV